MPTALFNTDPNRSIKGLLDLYPWNVCLHLNPEIPWLDHQSTLILGDRILRHTQEQLYGRNPDGHYGVFVLVPERCPQGLWHYHGFGWVKSAGRLKRLHKHGSEWFENAVHGFIRRGGCFVPDHLGGAAHLNLEIINPSALFQPLEKPSEAIYYAQKNWLRDDKEERVCLSGRQPA